MARDYHALFDRRGARRFPVACACLPYPAIPALPPSAAGVFRARVYRLARGFRGDICVRDAGWARGSAPGGRSWVDGSADGVFVKTAGRSCPRLVSRPFARTVSPGGSLGLASLGPRGGPRLLADREPVWFDGHARQGQESFAWDGGAGWNMPPRCQGDTGPGLAAPEAECLPEACRNPSSRRGLGRLRVWTGGAGNHPGSVPLPVVWKLLRVSGTHRRVRQRARVDLLRRRTVLKKLFIDF